MSFWDAIEQHVAELDESERHARTVPDPWANVAVDDAGLTEAQVAHLAGLDDQPPVPHLTEEDAPGEEPGDHPATSGPLVTYRQPS